MSFSEPDSEAGTGAPAQEVSQASRSLSVQELEDLAAGPPPDPADEPAEGQAPAN